MAKIAYDLDRLMPHAGAGNRGALPPFVVIRQDGLALLRSCASAMPLQIRRQNDGTWFELQPEPLVSVVGKNTVVRRKAVKSKFRGTIKERWCQDDYEVTIRGVVSGADESEYPGDAVRRIAEFFEARQAVEVRHEMLGTLGIYHLIIESVSFPHTPGLNNQSYEIKACSDETSELLTTI